MKTAALLVLVLLVLSSAAGAIGGAPLPSSEALNVRGGGGRRLLKSATFLSPPFFLRPGSVANKYYHDISFPRGHVAVKSFKGEVVDERGAPVPLHETYVHHWVVRPYYAAENATARPATILKRNAGVCEGDTHGQYFGLGSETRRTATWVPDPYAVEAGDPAAPREGYVEKWMLNVHAIDTRGTVDKVACTECRCDLYNVTVDEHGRGIPGDYAGGLRCCYDQTRCKVEEGLAGGGEARKLFFRYTVVWLDWSDAAAAAAVVPVRIYIFDVTHRAMPVGCMVEYEVEECSAEKRAKSDCVHVKVTKQVLPRGGDLVYAVAHQHAGAIGSSLHGQDGRLLCESTPIYGGGVEAGDEAGYIVGMSTCYPKKGTVRVRDGEVLTVVSNYSSERRHTGVMGLFAVLVADRPEQQPAAPSSSVSSNLL